MAELLPETKGAAKLSFWRTVRVVAWAFVGLRNRSGHKEDMEQVKPVHVIVVGVLGALFLVLTLVWLVNTVLAA
jgi:ABC-type xylose transport system permease subunit